ncbi:hypothetical protein ACIRQP_35750 [Streptomyces sp. NPDC102274]|uniref:NACHT N-terminal Helical domain 1-containing protein n=1 Tax=Streptomyces sp. NPDC102274 TaxID=3366151 RepID=UPI00381EEBB3
MVRTTTLSGLGRTTGIRCWCIRAARRSEFAQKVIGGEPVVLSLGRRGRRCHESSLGVQMEPAVIGARLASSVVSPLIRKLFLNGGPGAGLVDKPVRVSRLVSFRGEQRTLSDKALHRIAEELVRRAVQATGTEEQLSSYETRAVINAVAESLRVMGTLDMDDVRAVTLASGFRTPSRTWRLAM